MPMSDANNILSLFARALGKSLKDSVAARDAQVAARHERIRQAVSQVSQALGASPAAQPVEVPARPAPSAVPPPVARFGRRATPPSEPRVAENITVVLRRQVPIRHDEPARSWLGGLPVLPDAVEWPRGVNPENPGEGARPLHFLAQISCADLPADLWGGLGPREGWLLFFLNNNTSSQDDPETHRVIHVHDWGRERQLPSDIGQVHDGVYTGSNFTSYMDQADVPTLWRRWPVDLVTFPNALHHDGPRSFGTPPDFAPTLYPDLPIGGERDRAPAIEPFSWRCLEGVRTFLHSAAPVPPTIHPNEQALRSKLQRSPLTAILDRLDEREAEFDAGETGRLLIADPETIEESRRPQLERARKYKQDRRDRRTAIAELIARYPDSDAMLAFLESERLRRAHWRAAAVQRFAALDAAIGTNPDTPLPAEQWEEIRSALESDRFIGWFPAYLGGTHVIIEEQTETSWQRMGPRVVSATHEIAADYYVDPMRRHLVPDAAISLLEPWWRRLDENRPHKMGGYHDGVQSDAEEGPTEAPLLLQLATDDAMQWCWGDAGAVYWFVPAAALAGGRVGKAACQLECH
jgi:uncharacterized protein YwqG